MKNRFLLLIMFLASFGNSHSQTITAGPFFCKGYENSIDLQTISKKSRLYDNMGNAANMSLTRGDDTNGEKWIDHISNMPEYLSEFYDTYGDKAKEVLNGGDNWLSDPTMGTFSEDMNGYYTTIKTFTGNKSFELPKDASKSLIQEYAYNAIDHQISDNWKEADCFMYYLCICLRNDYPEAFWHTNTFSWGGYTNYSLSYNISSGTGTVEYSQTIYFLLSDNKFDGRIAEMQDKQMLRSAVTEFNQATVEITESCKGNRYETIAALNDWLTNHNCYNSQFLKTDSTSALAWSAISAIRGGAAEDGPVCEGYAKAFKVLCNLKDIPCRLVSGNAISKIGNKPESHAWNEVQMEDGQWYAVDVTWNDPTDGTDNKVSGKENKYWFLLGQNDIVANNLTFAESHPIYMTEDIDSAYVAQWDCHIGSLISDYRHDPSSDIHANRQDLDRHKKRAYTINGRYLGEFTQEEEILSIPGNKRIIITNGKKIIK